jgi:hypothetical protein
MTSPELGTVTQDNTATAEPAAVRSPAGVMISSRGRDDAVERAFEAAVRDPARLGDLLDALAAGRLWLPLARPGQGPLGTPRPVAGRGGVRLPTVRYLGALLVPAFTSAARLARALQDETPGERSGVVPHAVVAAAQLARLLPAGLGLALNPGHPASVPVYPRGVAYLAAEHTMTTAGRISVGPLAETLPPSLLAGLRAGLNAVPAVRQAAPAWLCVAGQGEGMIISVELDDPADAGARDATLAAIERAVSGAGSELPGPVDVTFPGEGEPDLIDRWTAAHARPFYQRSGRAEVASLPAPRPASP